MDEFVKIAEELRSRMWRTAGARYLAANRLGRRDRYSTFSIAILSVLAIGFGLLEPHISEGAKHVGFSAVAITAIISVFILAISLIEGSSRTTVQASKLHDNAVAISGVRSRLESMLARAKIAGTPDWPQFDELRLEYETRIRECPYNHEPIDYQQFEANRRKSPEFLEPNGAPRMGWAKSRWVKVMHLTSAAWLSFLSWAVVVALVFFVFDWTPPKEDISAPPAGSAYSGQHTTR